MARAQLPREFFIPKNATKVVDKLSDAVAYIYESNGKPCARVFYGKQSQPVIKCYFTNAERRAAAVQQAFADRRDSLARKADRRKERTAWIPDYKVGEILHTNWGYDQTNVEYFEIIDVKGKYVTLRELAQERTETGFMSGNCVPLPGKYLTPRYDGDDRGVPIRRLAQQHGIKIDDVRYAFRNRTETVAGVTVHRPLGWSSYA